MHNQLVIFGASGDLTSRKLVPALFELFRRGRLPEPTTVVGIARTEKTSDQWRDELAESTAEHCPKDQVRRFWPAFAQSLFYMPGNVDNPSMYEELKRFLAARPGDSGDSGGTNRVYYLAVAPRLYPVIVERLGDAGLAREDDGCRAAVIVEKPFGRDLESAVALNRRIHRVFDERQIFRIDHYLGKETVNNIFALRFANTIFEPIWNRQYIDHVQITANESQKVGRRGPFYETAGVLRDMFQNHLLQLLAITAMEPPARFEADAVRDEKVKVLRAIRPVTGDTLAQDAVFGQYDGYRDEPGVAPDSRVPTFAAVRLHIDNFRWKGVPFYLRSGKAMSCQTTQIVIEYREPPHSIFGKGFEPFAGSVNRLLVQIQPSEGIRMSFLSKVPGTEMDLRSSELVFSFRDHFQGELPEAYQRLLLDALAGDSSLFARNDEVEQAWSIIDPIRRGQESDTFHDGTIARYTPGDWGPDESRLWMANQSRNWFDLCPVLH